ncbi:hypothetical protein PS838_00961 [Pseudomonas fluorescens]|nr:hypothetical protein PS838_00961 [Pseudomonas fluorescens]
MVNTESDNMAGSDKKEQKLASNEFASSGAAPLVVQEPDVSAFVIKDDPLGLIPRTKLDTDQKTTIATWGGSLPTTPSRTEYFRLQIARAHSEEWTTLQEHAYAGRPNPVWVPLDFNIPKEFLLDAGNEGAFVLRYEHVTGKIEVPIGVKWLIDNRGGDVSVDYQYARPDAAGSGATLNLTVREQLELPPPTVDDSVVSDKRDELDPAVAIGGAYITIPANSAIGDLEVTAYWKGFGESGSFETNVPSQTEPVIKFRVPPEYLPPNFGKTVEVTYKVDGQEADASLLLYIRQLGDPPGIACNLVGVGSPATLKLSAFTDEGGVLSMRRWPFISTQQQVRFWLSSLDIGDREIMAARNILPEEVSAGVKVSLFKEHLAGITINNQVTFKASVSFDGGNSTVAFGVPLAVKLLD